MSFVADMVRLSFSIPTHARCDPETDGAHAGAHEDGEKELRTPKRAAEA